LVKAIPRTNVKLFVPSDIAHRVDEQGLLIPVNKAKFEVEEAAKQARIPTTVVLPVFFTESAISKVLVKGFWELTILGIGSSSLDIMRLSNSTYG
jgi:hypothetical protein